MKEISEKISTDPKDIDLDKVPQFFASNEALHISGSDPSTLYNVVSLLQKSELKSLEKKYVSLLYISGANKFETLHELVESLANNDLIYSPKKNDDWEIDVKILKKLLPKDRKVLVSR